MPAPSWENLDHFLQLDDVGGFAVTAKISFRDENTREIAGIFDEPYLNAQLGEYEVDDAQPRFTCKELDCVGIKRGDYLTLQNGKQYFIMTYPQEDGTGLCILKLEERGDST
ncbi:hypothetical protein ACG9Y7_04125 [Acinetobacter gerneri]|uniref:head-tail joining protein n=1 Tax=Acinetobacter gerneri TaxID=202952 RepID=UPI003AF6E044